VSDNLKRIISGFVLVLILVVLAVIGGPLLLAFCGVISVIGLREYFCAIQMKDSPLAMASYILAGLYYIGLLYFGKTLLLPFLIIAFFVLMLIYLIKFPAIKIHEYALAFTGIVYVPVFMGFLYLVYQMPQGRCLFALVFLASWLGDTCGYVVGRRIGKHKMTPVLSPKKSWEGLIGEIVGVTLICTVFGLIFRSKLDMSYRYPLIACIGSGLAGSLVSVCGDLFASAIKREYGIKDYGKLIPGHGGILDRFDSVLFTAPFIFLIFSMVGF